MSHNPAPAPCNSCGSMHFVAASSPPPNAATLPSKCAGCGSLSQHRVARAVFTALPRELLQGTKCLRMTLDPALDPAWFAQVEEVALPTGASPAVPAASASYAWVYAALPLQGAQPEEAALLQDMLRVAGRRCVVLTEGVSSEHEAAQGPLVGRAEGASLRGSAYGDAVRAALPKAAVLELTGLDSSSLKLESVYVASLDSDLLVRMAEAIVRRNVHARVFPSAELDPLGRLRSSLPPELDLAVYRSLHPDLAKFSDQSLFEHYQQYGQSEGRRCNSLKSPQELVALLGQDLDVLELGPSHSPPVSGARVHFVSRDADLSVVTGTFDAVISNHVVEHQPDFIGHLEAVRRLLRPGGLYFVLVPDKNYCFDHFNAPSTIAELLEAHVTGRTRHTLRSAVNFALRAHNHDGRHWAGDHGTPESSVAKIEAGVKQYMDSKGVHDDTHGWYFEPKAFRESMALLLELGETEFSVLRLYPTRHGRSEFWAVLAADGGAS